MFRLTKTNTFRHRVDVSIPSDDPDLPITGSFVCVSKRHDKDAFRDPTVGRDGGDEAFIRETLCAWRASRSTASIRPTSRRSST